MNPSITITQFDHFLAERGLSLEAVLTGGAALAMLGVISRDTRDCDLLEPELTPEVQGAARKIAAEPSAEELAQAEAWIDPEDLNPDWPRHVRSTLQDLARRLGHGV